MAQRKRQVDVVLSPVMSSSAMKRLDKVLRAVAPKEVTVTLIGESGAGKEVLARRTHDLSERRSGPFVPINCAAIPESLFESELFGHERGAFTGASERVTGKIESASGGTLFLDEIGEMPLAMQAKLLRFLENRRFMRVGGTTKLEADVRLVFATLRPLEDEVKAGRFRADLFYRIQGITIVVPPLRERRPDIAPLLTQFVAELSARHGVAPPRLTRRAKAFLLAYEWPGNVRELRNVIETLCLLRDGRSVRIADLPAGLRARTTADEPQREVPGGTLSISIDDGLESLTRKIVEAALSVDGGDKGRAAKRLGVSRRTIERYVATGRVASPREAPSARFAPRPAKAGAHAKSESKAKPMASSRARPKPGAKASARPV